MQTKNTYIRTYKNTYKNTYMHTHNLTNPAVLCAAMVEMLRVKQDSLCRVKSHIESQSHAYIHTCIYTDLDT